MNTSVTLIVNGEMRDYDAHIEGVVENVLKKLLPQMPGSDTNDFKIMPQMAYRISDSRIIELFGCQEIKSNPSQAVINRLRNAGIEPQKRGRSGSIVMGYQILEYIETTKRNNQPFLYK